MKKHHHMSLRTNAEEEARAAAALAEQQAELAAAKRLRELKKNSTSGKIASKFTIFTSKINLKVFFDESPKSWFCIRLERQRLQREEEQQKLAEQKLAQEARALELKRQQQRENEERELARELELNQDDADDDEDQGSEQLVESESMIFDEDGNDNVDEKNHEENFRVCSEMRGKKRIIIDHTKLLN